MVILIRIYAFYFGSPRRIKYSTFTALRRFTYLYGIMALYMAHDGVAVETVLFLATFVVRMFFRNGVSSPFPEVWKGSVSKNSADVAVPRLCVFPSARGGLPAACRRVRDVTRLHLYAYLCTRLHGGSTCGAGTHSRLIPLGPHILPRYTRHVLVACV